MVKSPTHIPRMAVVLIAVAVGIYKVPRVIIPSHMQNHPVYFKENLIPESLADELFSMVKSMKRYPTNAADVTFYKAAREHIGEAVQVDSNGRCDMHPLLVHSLDRTQCVLPGRVDIAAHFIKSGGVDGLKEDYQTMISRVQSFGRYMFNLTEYPSVQELFEQDEFQSLARSICPAEKQYLDPFQFNFILQIPGQTVPVHLDGAYFWGANRQLFPQWLLAAMVFSGLFKDKFIDQVQVVGYLHRWDPKTKPSGSAGQFVFWRNESIFKPEEVSPNPRAGSAVDGSKTLHAAKVYLQQEQPPYLDKSAENILTFEEDSGNGEGHWELSSNGNKLRDYELDDVRISVVYRAKCFKNQSEAKRYNSNLKEDEMSLEYILKTLAAELVTRGWVGSIEEALEIPRLELAELILKNFVTYPVAPLSTAWFPLNYCALPRLMPWTAPYISIIC